MLSCLCVWMRFTVTQLLCRSVQWSSLPVLNRWHCDRLGWGRTAGPAVGSRRERPAANLCLQGHAGVRMCLHTCVFVDNNQSLTIHNVTCHPCFQGSSNNWLRIIPRTKFGSFARGAKVTAFTKQSGAQTRIIDGGSGYLCEMEPVAHFGLGKL